MTGAAVANGAVGFCSRRAVSALIILLLGEILAAGSLPAADTGGPEGRMPPGRPNVLLIIADQLSLRAMSAHGNPYVNTPAMDRLARSGVRFENSYTASPVCAPARGALFTGIMPHTTGYDFNIRFEPEVQRTGFGPGIRTLGELLGGAGYETVYGGKWSLPRTPADLGFERVIYESDALGAIMDEPLAEATAAYLRSRTDHRPFFVVASFHNPHDISHWIMAHGEPREHVELDRYPPLPSNFEPSPHEPDFYQRRRARTSSYGTELDYTHLWSEADWRAYLNAYYRYIEQVDRSVGVVLDALRGSGLEENTIVIFTSDHGEGMAAHRWVVKLGLYEEPAAVPLLFSWPGVLPADVSNAQQVVSGIDVLPTLSDLLGIPVPPGVQGQSLRSVLEGRSGAGRRFAVTELANNPDEPSEQGRMLRTRDFKYVAFSYGRIREQLFDMKGDPGEMYNLALDPAWADALVEHRKLLRSWLQATDDPFEPIPEEFPPPLHVLPTPAPRSR